MADYEEENYGLDYDLQGEDRGKIDAELDKAEEEAEEEEERRRRRQRASEQVPKQKKMKRTEAWAKDVAENREDKEQDNGKRKGKGKEKEKGKAKAKKEERQPVTTETPSQGTRKRTKERGQDVRMEAKTCRDGDEPVKRRKLVV